MDELNKQTPPPQIPPTSNQMHSSFENSHHSKTIPIIIGAVLLVLVGAGSFLLGSNKKSAIKTACTMEAKLCPDGTSVGRTGPKCEFAPCPTPTIDQTANWKTYTSTKFDISYKYPSDWNNDNVCQSCSAQPIIESSSERYLHPTETKYPVGITYGADAKANSVPLSFFINSLKTNNLTNKTTKELSINGSDGFEVTGNDEDGKKIALAVFENKDFIFQFRSSEDYINILETLLSTFKFTDQNQTNNIATKEQAIECVEKEALKDYPNTKFKVIVNDENDTTWYTRVVRDTPEQQLMGYYPVDKITCETHFAKP